MVAPIFVFGYPADLGGANVEMWHTVQLWRNAGLPVRFIPTWTDSHKWRDRLTSIGCEISFTDVEKLQQMPGLSGSIVINFCNEEFAHHAPKLKKIGCKLVWLNCMTFLFEHERRCFDLMGLPDAFVYQSQYQAERLREQLRPWKHETSLHFKIA